MNFNLRFLHLDRDPAELERQAQYLLNVSVFLKNPNHYDEAQRQAQDFLAEAERLRGLAAAEEKQGAN